MPNRNEISGATRDFDPNSKNVEEAFAENLTREAAVWIEDGRYVPKKSFPSLVEGTPTDTGADGVVIRSGLERLNGIVVTGKDSRCRVENCELSLSGYGIGDMYCLGTGILSAKEAEVEVTGCSVITAGAGRSCTEATQGGVLRVSNSTLIARGGTPSPDYVPEISNNMVTPPEPLGLGGTCRTHVSLDHSRSFFEKCEIWSAGWGALSTDSSGGWLLLDARDCTVTVDGNGYATYADDGSHVRLTRCRVRTGNMLVIQAANSSFDAEDCDVECAGPCMVLHAGYADWIDTGLVSVTGGCLRSKGDMILAKSTNVDVYLKGTELVCENGVLIRTVVTDDAYFSTVRSTGEGLYGVQVTFDAMEVSGDILHEDTERKLAVSLDNAGLTGKITGGAELRLYGNSRWVAAADSELAFLNTLEGVDAPDGVTVRVQKGPAAGSYSLPSGGNLIVTE